MIKGRPRMLDVTVDSIRVAYLQSPRKSLRPAEQEFNISSLEYTEFITSYCTSEYINLKFFKS